MKIIAILSAFAAVSGQDYYYYYTLFNTLSGILYLIPFMDTSSTRKSIEREL